MADAISTKIKSLAEPKSPPQSRYKFTLLLLFVVAFCSVPFVGSKYLAFSSFGVDIEKDFFNFLRMKFSNLSECFWTAKPSWDTTPTELREGDLEEGPQKTLPLSRVCYELGRLPGNIMRRLRAAEAAERDQKIVVLADDTHLHRKLTEEEIATNRLECHRWNKVNLDRHKKSLILKNKAALSFARKIFAAEKTGVVVSDHWRTKKTVRIWLKGFLIQRNMHLSHVTIAAWADHVLAELPRFLNELRAKFKRAKQGGFLRKRPETTLKFFHTIKCERRASIKNESFNTGSAGSEICDLARERRPCTPSQHILGATPVGLQRKIYYLARQLSGRVIEAHASSQKLRPLIGICFPHAFNFSKNALKDGVDEELIVKSWMQGLDAAVALLVDVRGCRPEKAVAHASNVAKEAIKAAPCFWNP